MMDPDSVRRNSGSNGLIHSPHNTTESESGKLQFLLNKDLKEVNMNIFPEGDWPAVLKGTSEVGEFYEGVLKFTQSEVWVKIPKACVEEARLKLGSFARFEDIQEVRFDLSEDSDTEGFPRFEDIVEFVDEILCYLPNVRVLYLGEYCDDLTLAIIRSYCLKLEKLVMISCYVTDKGLESLRPFQWERNKLEAPYPHLKFLSLSSVYPVRSGIGYLLENMPSLEEIVHNDLPDILYDLYKKDTSERKYNLTSLYLNNIKMLQDNFIETLNFFINICPHINKLSLTILRKEQLDWCSSNLNFLELKDLNLYNLFNNLDLNNSDLNNFLFNNLDLNNFLMSKGRILQSLRLKNFNFSIVALLQSCPQLEILYLENITFQSFEFATVLQPLLNLEKLFLEGFDFRMPLTCESVIRILKPSQNIRKNEVLSYLKFTKCYIDINFLQPVLSTCSNLKTLVVDNCDNITVNDIESLSESFSNIKIIWSNKTIDSNSGDPGSHVSGSDNPDPGDSNSEDSGSHDSDPDDSDPHDCNADDSDSEDSVADDSDSDHSDSEDSYLDDNKFRELYRSHTQRNRDSGSDASDSSFEDEDYYAYDSDNE